MLIRAKFLLGFMTLTVFSVIVSADESRPRVNWKLSVCPLESQVLMIESESPFPAITYDFSGGRFGDNLVAYFHAKWLAMKFGVPFLYKPFPLSNCLGLDERDIPFEIYKDFPQADVNRLSQIYLDGQPQIYVVKYFPEFKPELALPQMQGVFSFEVDWNDPLFREELLACMAPKKELKLINPPEGYFTVAIHVRRGGGFESYATGLQNEPLKFPPDSFYIGEIKRVSELYHELPLYVHIFTDDEHPEWIAESYKSELEGIDVQFEWEQNPSHSDPDQILRDFYSMGQFDCLIHPGSNFSIMANIIGRSKLDIVPLHYYRVGLEPIIDEVEITTR